MSFLTRIILLSFIITALIMHADGRVISKDDKVNTKQHNSGEDHRGYELHFHQNEDPNIDHLEDEHNIDSTQRNVFDSTIGNQEHSTNRDVPTNLFIDQKSGKVCSTCGTAFHTRRLNGGNLYSTNVYQVPATAGDNEQEVSRDVENAHLFKELFKAQLKYFSLDPDNSIRERRFTTENNDMFSGIPESITSERALGNSGNYLHQFLQPRVDSQREKTANDASRVENKLGRDGHGITSNVPHLQRNARIHRQNLVTPRNIADTNSEYDDTLQFLTKLGEFVSNPNSDDKEESGIHSLRQDSNRIERDIPLTSKEEFESNDLSPDIGDYLLKSVNDLLDKDFGLIDENVMPLKFENDAETY